MDFVQDWVLFAICFSFIILHIWHIPALRGAAQAPYDIFGMVGFIYLKCEYLVMRLANKFVIGSWSWFFRSRLKRFIFDTLRLAAVNYRAISLEPYTIEESKAIVKNIFRRNETKVLVANRICPCRAATNKITNGNGGPYDDKPIVTDIMFLTKPNLAITRSKAAKGFMRFITIPDVLKKLDRFEEAGLVHAFMGPCDAIYGTVMMTICNCHPDICLPLAWHKKRNFSFFAEGHNIAVVDSTKCTGCGHCVTRCPVRARKLVNGKSVVLQHCFGCGTCRVTCEGHATHMVATKHHPHYFPVSMIRNKDGMALS